MVDLKEAKRLINAGLFAPEEGEVIVASVSPGIMGTFCIPFADMELCKQRVTKL